MERVLEECALQALAAWAYQFSARLAFGPSLLLVEVEGSRRLFGGARALQRRVAAGLGSLGYRAQLALAPTPLGASLLARTIGLKRAKEIWFLCRQYDAQEALAMRLVNTVVPLADLETETVSWCRQMLRHSPTALRLLKCAFNADSDGLAGIQELAGNATGLFYTTAEAQEGRDAFLQKRVPDFGPFRR